MARRVKNGAKERILRCVTDYIDAHGCSPTYREIADAAGFRSRSTVQRYVAMLEADGKLEPRAARTRALKPFRSVTLDGNAFGQPRRVRLEIADGGCLCFDCSLKRNEGNEIGIRFNGVLDASQLKGRIGRVVGCGFEEDEKP